MGAPGYLAGMFDVQTPLLLRRDMLRASRVLPVPLSACGKGTAMPRGILNP